MKIIIFGGSGSGTSTLGKALAEQQEWQHLDVDDYYWKKTNPPFEEKIPKSISNVKLRTDINICKNVVVSGSLVSWGDYWHTVFDLAIFLHIPADLRMNRLQIREIERYGTKLKSDPHIQTKSIAFLDWAKQYDDPDFEGRSIRHHENWMQNLSCPSLKIEGDTSVKERLVLIMQKLEKH